VTDTPSTEASYVYDEANEARCTLPDCHCRYSGRPPRHPVAADTPSTEEAADPPCHRASSSTYCTTHDAEWAMDGLFRCPAVRRGSHRMTPDTPSTEALTVIERALRNAYGDVNEVWMPWALIERAVRQEAAHTSGLTDRAVALIVGSTQDERGQPPIEEAADTSGLREALDVLDVIDGIVDDTHPEGDGCPLCTALDDLRAALEGATERPLDVDAERLAEAMRGCDGVAWPKGWREAEHNFDWVARQVAAAYRRSA
jgi:hypothetical protein